MKKSLLIIFIFILYTANAQQIKVIERESKRPIENVTIYDDDKNTVVYTNKKGLADLSEFKDSDVLSFNHISFIEFEILKRDLGVLEFVVVLSKKAELLEEIILSASRSEEKRSRIAEDIEIISAEEIKEMAPQTSADMLANIPGIKVQKSQFGGGSPVLRGMEANKVLLVVDGVRMNNAIYRMGHLQNSITVSPTMLKRTEVIFGPSSVIYGSDALGGVIHYYTKTPEISDENDINTTVFSQFSSANNEFTLAADIELRNKKWASLTSVSNSKFGDLRMGNNRVHGFDDWGKVYEYSNNSDTFYNPNVVLNENKNIQKNTNISQTDLLQKFVFPLSINTDLIFNFQYSSSSNIDRFDKLTEYSGEQLKFAEWYYGPQERLLLSSQLKIQPDFNWMQHGTFTFAFQDIKESRVQRNFNSLDRSYRLENVDIYSLNGDFFVPVTKDNDRIISYGFELIHNDVQSNAYGKTLQILNNEVVGFSDTFNVQSRYPDGGSTYASIAGYANYRQNISKKTTLNTGVRFVNTRLTATWIDDSFITLPSFDISNNNASLTATVGIVFKPTPDWQLNTVVSSGFRSPNIDDVGKIREKSGDVTVPNIYLKPEYAYNFESGFLKYFNHKNFQAGLNVYYTLLDNYIMRDAFTLDNETTIMYDGEEGNIVANVNKNNAYITGTTLSFKGTIFNNWFTKGAITYTQGKTYDTDLPLSSIPPLFGMFEAGFHAEKFQASLNWRFNAAKKLSNYNLVEGIDNIEQTPFNTNTNNYYGTPAWNIFNLQTKYTINNNASFFVNVNNIFDVHYKEFASAISAPGRNLSISFLLSLP